MPTVGEYFENTLIRGIDEGIGAPGNVQSFHGTPRDSALELMTGSPGPVGQQGESAPAFRWEGDIKQAALTAMTPKLTAVHAGKSWRVLADETLSSDTLMYWNGTGFDTFADAFGAMGPDGQPCTLSIGTVETGPVGSDLQVTVTGTGPNLVLNLTVPRGVKGLKGELGGPGPIRQAPDYADGPHTDRTIPMWSPTTQKWTPQPYPGLRGPWSIVDRRAWDNGPGFAESQFEIAAAATTVAQLKIPAQDVSWRPVVAGGVFHTPLTDSFDNRVDGEVRIGSADGQLVALGVGGIYGMHGYTPFLPHYGRRMTPDSTIGVVPAGQATTLFVVLRRKQGDTKYNYFQGSAQIVCWARPVAAQ